MSWQTMLLVATWFVGIVHVAAPSSMTDVLPKLIEAYNAENVAQQFKTTLDATSKLAKQIEQGAKYDVFISADAYWARKLIDQRIIATGHLVVVVPVNDTTHARTLQELDPKRLALAGEHVPAGKYAEAALKAVNRWDALKPRVVRADNVRGALKWVAMGECDAGIVYLSDTLAEPRVRLAIGIDSSLHPRIEYVAGLPKPSENGRRFLDFLETEPARRVLVQHGFSRP